MPAPATTPAAAVIALPRPPLHADLVEEHFDELDFLWCQRALHLDAVDWTPDELGELEARAEAHRDGLRVWGARAVALARPRLSSEATAEATVAAFVLLDDGASELASLVTAALRESPPVASRALARALKHSEIGRLLPELRSLAAGGPPAARAAVAEALTFRRASAPESIPEPTDGDPETAIDVLVARGRARATGRAELDWALRHADPRVRRAGLEAAARAGVTELLPRCREAASGGDSQAAEALAILGCAGDPRDVALLTAAAAHEPLQAAAFRALGACGRIEAVPFLLECLADASSSAHAAAALRRITAAPGPLTVEEEDPGAESGVRAFWERQRSRFDPRVRWQLGEPASAGTKSPAFGRWTLAVRRDAWIGECALSGGDSGSFDPEELQWRGAAAV